MPVQKDGKDKVKLGIIGLGGRARSLLKNLLSMDDILVVSLADRLRDRLAMGRKMVEDAGQPSPASYRDHQKLLARDDVEGVIIGTAWTSHIKLSIEAMQAGAYAAPEVGGASSLAECRELVRTSENTGVPCMLLENCCYGRRELAVMNMVKQGIFGELVHCQCGYLHDLRKGLVKGRERNHFRVEHHIKRNGDLYPTHGLGPVAKHLDINRGNRFLTLSSIASKARGLREWAVSNLGEGHPMSRREYTKGDIITTMLKCAHGETVLVVHDTSLPRPYSRGGLVQGTRGIWMEDKDSVYIEGKSPSHQWEPFENYLKKYEHPLWKEFLTKGIRGGHGGMDYLTLRAFADSVKEKKQTPIDAYDTATWMAVTALSEQSVAMGGAAVPFPDFTDGKWLQREPAPTGKYSLDSVPEELF